MLFNSYEFIFLYLPIVFFGFIFIGKHKQSGVVLWLAVASLFFYGYWEIKFLLLLLGSIIFNYGSGYLIAQSSKKSRLIFFVSISVNLVLLGIFKYANFFIATSNTFGTQWSSLAIVLPLGISFFTFTQIAYLVDVYKGIAHEYNFIDYLLFVTWFPHLVAGPVLHHKQMMPQFSSSSMYKPNYESIAVGLTLFSLGLFKKVILADNLAPLANRVFNDAAQGGLPMIEKAWFGVLAYTLQLYFDFSGYSDMAIGLSRIFNVKLPLNFNSPYKAANIIEFWRRWHITLSKFLRDYLYVPLGGNRKGAARRYVNVLVTMLLGGLWHGAGWNFVLWGGLHGLYLVVNHTWRTVTNATGIAKNRLTHTIGVLITFIAVMIAWVPFRATSMSATQNIWYGMIGLNGHEGDSTTLGWYIAGLLIIWALPNTQQWLSKYAPAWDNVAVMERFSWKPGRALAIITGIIFAASVVYFKKNSQFLYFQF